MVFQHQRYFLFKREYSILEKQIVSIRMSNLINRLNLCEIINTDLLCFSAWSNEKFLHIASIWLYPFIVVAGCCCCCGCCCCWGFWICGGPAFSSRSLVLDSLVNLSSSIINLTVEKFNFSYSSLRVMFIMLKSLCPNKFTYAFYAFSCIPCPQHCQHLYSRFYCALPLQYYDVASEMSCLKGKLWRVYRESHDIALNISFGDVARDTRTL